MELKLRRMNDSISKLEDELDSIRQKISQLDVKIDVFSRTLKTDYTTTIIERFQGVESMTSRIDEILFSIQKNITQQETMINSMFEEIKNLQQEIIRQNDRMKETNRRISDIENRILLSESGKEIKEAAERLRRE